MQTFIDDFGGGLPPRHGMSSGVRKARPITADGDMLALMRWLDWVDLTDRELLALERWYQGYAISVHNYNLYVLVEDYLAKMKEAGASDDEIAQVTAALLSLSSGQTADAVGLIAKALSAKKTRLLASNGSGSSDPWTMDDDWRSVFNEGSDQPSGEVLGAPSSGGSTFKDAWDALANYLASPQVTEGWFVGGVMHQADVRSGSFLGVPMLGVGAFHVPELVVAPPWTTTSSSPPNPPLPQDFLVSEETLPDAPMGAPVGWDSESSDLFLSKKETDESSGDSTGATATSSRQSQSSPSPSSFATRIGTLRNNLIGFGQMMAAWMMPARLLQPMTVLASNPSNRLHFGPDSAASQAMLDSEGVQELVEAFYRHVRDAATDRLQADVDYSPLAVNWVGQGSGNNKWLEEHYYTGKWVPALVGTFHFEFAPDLQRGELHLTIDNVTSIESIMGHQDVPWDAAASWFTSVPTEQAFPYDDRSEITSQLRNDWIGRPFGNVSQTFEIVLPLDYSRLGMAPGTPPGPNDDGDDSTF